SASCESFHSYQKIAFLLDRTAMPGHPHKIYDMPLSACHYATSEPYIPHDDLASNDECLFSSFS
ncbi:MAG: hypothetical protein ACON39_08120, partial [Coraliomargaritaceae bacterium]